MKSLKNSVLPLAVFITGACVLIIEVVATRILSLYYGNTIFTVSSVISVILAALSFGYYAGGKIADRYPHPKWFFSIILLSGISMLLLQLLNTIALPFLGYILPITTGPLISALILFFLPALLLGTLSPYAIKLQKIRLPNEGIGSVAGKIFFWSTLGSIFGSLLTGFVLIPHFGVNQIIVTNGVILFLLGLIPFIGSRVEKKNFYGALLAFSIVFGATLLFPNQTGKNIVFSKDGVYEKITIYDDKYKERPTRFLQQDRSHSGAMFLDSDELVYDYTQYYALYKILKPDVENALVIGGGAYSIPKALLKNLPEATVDVSEIDSSLFELAQKYFKLVETERLHNYTEDGRRLLHDTDKKYDLIFNDVYYSLFSIPVHFTTQEFFEIVKNRLNEDGVFIANLIGDLSQQRPSFILSEIKTFRTVFPNSYFFAVNSPDKIETQNIIFVGYNSDKNIDFNNQEITENENSIIQSLEKKIINLEKFELSSYPLLTDNFSPVEYLTGKVLQRSFTR